MFGSVVQFVCVCLKVKVVFEMSGNGFFFRGFYVLQAIKNARERDRRALIRAVSSLG